MRRVELMKQRHDLKEAMRRTKNAVDKMDLPNEDDFSAARFRAKVKARLNRNLKKSYLKKSLRRNFPDPCCPDPNKWYTFSDPNCSNLLDEVVITAYRNNTPLQRNKDSELFDSPFFDAKSANRGLLLGRGLNTAYGSALDSHLKAALKTKSLTEIASKQLRTVQTGSRVLGNTLHAVNVGVSYYQYSNDEIGLGRFSYRLAGTGSSIYIGAIYGGPYGLAVGLLYAGGESYYNAVQKDRAYNRAARESDSYIDNNGVRKQNQQTFSSENFEYYLSGGEYNSNDF